MENQDTQKTAAERTGTRTGTGKKQEKLPLIEGTEAWKAFVDRLKNAEGVDGHTSAVAGGVGAWSSLVAEVLREIGVVAKQQAGWTLGGRLSAEKTRKEQADRDRKIREEWLRTRKASGSDYAADKKLAARYGLNRSTIFRIRTKDKRKKRKQ